MYRCVRRKKRGFAGLGSGVWGGEMESFFSCVSRPTWLCHARS